MNAYRDQYAQTFNGGKGVTVLAISVDADTVHAAWAKEAGYPVTFVSDTAKSLGAPYAVLPAGRSAYSRVVSDSSSPAAKPITRSIAAKTAITSRSPTPASPSA